MPFNKKPNFLFNHRFLFNVPKGSTVKPTEGEEPARREKTAIITEVTEVKGTKKVERHDLADKKAAEEIVENKDDIPDAVHNDHLEKITAIAEEAAEKDRAKLKTSDIKTIRFNTRLLKEKADKEDDPAQATGIKEETQRRIKAYTSKCEKDWYTLDYQRLGSDSEGRSHENNIGLGDILLDPDIKTILVKRANGEIIIAHRGTVPARKTYAGRLGFLDENNEYVATHTGDQFRIIKNELTDFKKPEAVKKYLTAYKADEQVRQENEEAFEQESLLEGTSMLNFNREKNNKAKPLDNKEIIRRLNEKREEKDGETLLAYSQEACDKFGIPFSVFKELIDIESRWSPNAAYKGPVNSDASGLGQFLSSTWEGFVKYCNANDIHDEKWGPKPMTANSRFNPYACLYATAWLMNKTKKSFADFDKKNIAEQGYIYYVCHHEGLNGGKSFIKATAAGNCPKSDVLALANRVGYRAALSEGFDISTIEQDQVAFRIDNGKEGYNGKGILKISNKDEQVIAGSSGAVAMNNLKNGLNLSNTGFFGIVGISPTAFLEKLKEYWPQIEKLKKVPREWIIVGLAANGLGSNTDEAVQKNLDQYAVIKKFLEEKGVKVKIATVQPAAGLGEQISKFNDKLRETYDSETLIDIAKHTTTADGKNINPEYASSDGIHLSRRGYETFAKLIKEGANNETDRTA